MEPNISRSDVISFVTQHTFAFKKVELILVFISIDVEPAPYLLLNSAVPGTVLVVMIEMIGNTGVMFMGYV
jgi:hypothetical protein